MNETTRGNRLHIAIIGCRNAGKSSLVNALTKQDVAIVSDVAGTTTDPVAKNMEILPLGPVVLYDTAGIDDDSKLGLQRIAKTQEVLRKTDMAIVVFDAEKGCDDNSIAIADECRKKNIPIVIVVNKSDICDNAQSLALLLQERYACPAVVTSASKQSGMDDLRRALLQQAPLDWDEQKLIGDLVNNGETAVLVVPIDLAAPKGRLILPQVQVIRDLLDNDAIVVMSKERELAATLKNLIRQPKIVVTDSQVFLKVEADTPPDVMLTSFSVLFARFKGDLVKMVAGARKLQKLNVGCKVLLAEACTHHRVEDDIGRVKIPRWLRQHVGGQLQLDWVSGNNFPDNVGQYDLIVHCGGCMINRREMLTRIWQAEQAGVAITNYGLAIAAMQGILERAVMPFGL